MALTFTPPPIIPTPDYLNNPNQINITAPKLPTYQQVIGGLSPEYQQLLSKPVAAPTVGQVNTASLPEVKNFLPQIQQVGQMQIDTGLKALQRIFEPQRQLERERIDSRGLVGSGVENEVLTNLAKEQGLTAEKFVSEMEAANLQAQIQEMQRVSEMTENRALQILGINNERDLANLNAQLEAKGLNMSTAAQLARMNSDIALKQGDLQLAADQANQAAALDIGDQIIQQGQLAQDAYKTETDQIIAQYDAQLQEEGLTVDQRNAAANEFKARAEGCSIIKDDGKRAECLRLAEDAVYNKPTESSDTNETYGGIAKPVAPTSAYVPPPTGKEYKYGEAFKDLKVGDYKVINGVTWVWDGYKFKKYI